MIIKKNILKSELKSSTQKQNGLPRSLGIRACLMLILSALIVASHTVHAKTWDVLDYLKISLEMDENLKVALLKKDSAMSDFDIATDTFQNNLELRPSYLKRNLSTPSLPQPMTDARKGLSFQMDQIFPTGSSLGLQGVHYFEKSNPSFSAVSSDYKAYFEQALWKNSFGSLYRVQKKSAEYRTQQMDLAAVVTLLESCLTTLDLYIAAYLGQEELKIAELVFKDAKKAYDLAQSGYNRRILRKIDALNSQADFMRIQSDFEKAKTVFQQKLMAFHTKIFQEIALADSFLEPQKFFEQLQIPVHLDVKEVASYQSAIAKKEAESFLFQVKKNQSRSDLQVGAAATQTTSVQATAVGFGQAQYNTMEFYLRWKLPLINKTLDAQAQQAYYNMQMAEYQARQQERTLQQQFSQFTADRDLLSEQIQISMNSQKIKQQQLVEAQNLLRTGRLQFEEYVRYRDAFFNERLNTLRLKTNLWQTLAKLAQFQQGLAESCRRI